MDIINKNNLQNLLTSNWSTFIDQTKLMSEVLKSVRDDDLPIIHCRKPYTQKGIKITISRIEINTHGYLLWIEFTIPQQGSVTIGTLELNLTHNWSYL